VRPPVQEGEPTQTTCSVSPSGSSASSGWVLEPPGNASLVQLPLASVAWKSTWSLSVQLATTWRWPAASKTAEGRSQDEPSITVSGLVPRPPASKRITRISAEVDESG